MDPCNSMVQTVIIAYRLSRLIMWRLSSQRAILQLVGKILELPLTLVPEVSVSYTSHRPRSQRVHMGSVDPGTQKSPNSSSIPQTPYFFYILFSFQRTCDASGFFFVFFLVPFLFPLILAFKNFDFFLKFLSPVSSHNYLFFF